MRQEEKRDRGARALEAGGRARASSGGRRAGGHRTTLGRDENVSGAAVSPNAGYSTMPGLALLMTLFNLRLGVWSGNPGRAGDKSYRLRGPANALRPLLSEAFAQTDDQAKYVYLSDGGHFDNLSVYEMLRRRCRFIVISDPTCDPDYVYADLGSLVRKAAIDFGIRITFKHLDMPRRGETVVKGAYSAFAVIEYPEVNVSGRRQRGYLLYIKSYYGGLEEPADVRAYALENPAFPHDTTLNQFFGEAQFESYRGLGSYTVMELGRRAGFASMSKAEKPKSLREFFRGARRALTRSRAETDLIDVLRDLTMRDRTFPPPIAMVKSAVARNGSDPMSTLRPQTGQSGHTEEPPPSGAPRPPKNALV
jgi:hypothetical protein